jgi:DNA polymerase-3 subunit epsilon
MRLVAIDTETTGMNKRRSGDVCDGHRIIEVAAVEILNGKVTGRYFHSYVNPGIKVCDRAYKVHGVSDEFLKDKPAFSEIAESLLEFIGGSPLVIHNAEFDISFLDKEFHMLGEADKPYDKSFVVLDTLKTSRSLFPGEVNSLKGLCKRFNIDHSGLHNALNDAIMLANVYLAIYGQATAA